MATSDDDEFRIRAKQAELALLKAEFAHGMPLLASLPRAKLDTWEHDGNSPREVAANAGRPQTNESWQHVMFALRKYRRTV
jgi:hypothetical protein